mmetsp:Transcript_42535/g.112237  ORF Transcript_42535/g.112237 Transcript_42535/m.112237 type:complete len:249 (+) Transcript_42535:817-1563(+)
MVCPVVSWPAKSTSNMLPYLADGDRVPEVCIAARVSGPRTARLSVGRAMDSSSAVDASTSRIALPSAPGVASSVLPRNVLRMSTLVASITSSGTPSKPSCSCAMASWRRKSLMSTPSVFADSPAKRSAQCRALAIDTGMTLARDDNGRNASARCARCSRHLSSFVVEMMLSKRAGSKEPSFRTCILDIRSASFSSAMMTRPWIWKAASLPIPITFNLGMAMLLPNPRSPCSICQRAIWYTFAPCPSAI